ncbi:hypothetical protein MANES_06G007001v8 [Manihot esculenta]|uniref:Uncharacterized protein n=1 Tax=Manihot esculenta TaxID=3983 RepID=A0ACB7HFT8_MANES|nr:hypothetical protein MANES_06G007001v8 [Manihot esculenta]
MAHVSDIKLIRTDTTLDLSQKAEKGMLDSMASASFYSHSFQGPFRFKAMWDKNTLSIYFYLSFFKKIDSKIIYHFKKEN